MDGQFDFTRTWQFRALRLLWGSGGDWEPSVAQSATFNDFTQVGDPTADALVASIKGAHGQEVRRQFEVALADGIDEVADPSDELVAFFRESEAMPFWVDQRKLHRGAELLQGLGPLAAPMLMVGLSITYTTVDGNDVLLRSGDTRDKAGRRATETLAWVAEVTAPGNLDRGAPGYQSSLRVRLTHAFMRSGMGKRSDWDNPHLAVNQQVYSNVIIAFAVFPMIAALVSGKYFTRADRDAVFHLWRYVAHLIGVDHRLMAASEDDMMRLLTLFLREVIQPDANATMLGAALIDSYPEIYGFTGERRRDAMGRWLVINVHSALSRATLGGELSDHLGYPPVNRSAVPLLAAAVGAHGAFCALDFIPPVRSLRSRAMGRVTRPMLQQLLTNVQGSVAATFENKQARFGAVQEPGKAS